MTNSTIFGIVQKVSLSVALSLLLPMIGAAQHRPTLEPWDATYVLYVQAEEQWFPTCVAVPFEKATDSTLFFTAGHCVAAPTIYRVGDLRDVGKDATLLAVDTAGDVAILMVLGEYPLLSLGADPHVGEPAVVVYFPFMETKLITPAVIASDARPMRPWRNIQMLHGSTELGSSGAAIYCTAQRAVCGVDVGKIPALDHYAVFVPVSELKRLREGLND